ncbi:MAG: hypothetical protein GX629_03830, partial [Phycisphaerae bacterium]|nr:hypothetical protein [Phycisphaerae bacterium]
IETTNTNNHTDTVWIDDVTVTGEVVENVVATPVFTPDDRYVLGSKKVAISCATPDSQIRYTLDGSTPSPASSLYSTPITINLGETLCARAWVDGYVVSNVNSVTYAAFNNPPTIQSAEGDVVVDGDLSEWRGSEFVALDKTYSGSSPITQAGYAVRWDGTANQFYVAVKVNDPDRIFLDMYDKWNTQDGVEIYVHTTGGEPYAYEDTQSTAQQYVVGLKANRTGNPANDLWKTFAGDNPISGELAGQIGFQAAGVVEVDGQGNPTGWLFYEAAVKAYEYLDLTGGESIVSPLSAGDIVGVDVVICDKHASGFGMKSENTLLTKHDDWRSIGVHKLAPDWIDASTFGFESDDATFALQAAIDSGAKTVFVPDMGSDWIVRPIMLNSNNQEIVFEEGVVVCAKEGAFLRSTDCLFKAVAKQDLKLTGYGATLKMRKNDYLSSPYEDGEWRMGVGLWSCGNVTISGLTIKDTGGDGVYMGIWANEQNFCNDIVIRDVTLDNNYRQGISVISAERLLVENCVIRNTNGHSPQAGIDFEPNYDTQRLVDCVVRGTIIEGNAGDGILFSLNQMSSTNRNNATVTIEKCSLIGNGNHGLYLKNSLPGLAVRDSLFVGNDRYGVYQTIFMSPSPNIRYSAFWNNGSGAAGGSASLGTGCLTTVGPIFASADPLSEQYRYLALTCPAAITAGASDGSYMGARPKVSASRVPGDANEDGKVDVGDLGILAANYGMSEGATWQQGDFNEDGKVDVGDLGILAANYGSSGSSFEADYAKVFGTAVENEESAEDDFSSSICSGFGLPMIAGFILAGLMLVRLEE